MSESGVVATRLLVDDALRVIEALTDDDWACESACAGWRVQDVIVHMAVFFQSITDPSAVAIDEPPTLAERFNDATVAQRRDWPAARAAEYYEQQATLGLGTLEALQSPDLAEVMIPVAELGSYRLSQMSDAFAFDHLVHLTADILAPHGPITRAKVPIDDVRIGPALDWMLAGLPQMCGAALGPVLTRPLGLDLSGPGARRVVLHPAVDPSGVPRLSDQDPLPDDVVHSTTTDFLRWGTTRAQWRTAVTVTGDSEFAAAALDAINII